VAAVSLTIDDLTPFATIPEAKAQAMIDDALALAARVAPCIVDADFEYGLAAKAVLRGVVLRWNDQGTGAVTQASVDDASFTFGSQQQRRGLFWPSEIQQLQELCKTDEAGGAFNIDTVSTSVNHAEICAVNFGANYCSCGADLTAYAYPLYELP
jgi:hypothetical protein